MSSAYATKGPKALSGREEVKCFFSVLRKDGSIVVTMQKGMYGKIYRNAGRVPVTTNGITGGFRTLHEGMPITLILQKHKLVEIQIMSTGGNGK
jgi:hypothetical protein